MSFNSPLNRGSFDASPITPSTVFGVAAGKGSKNLLIKGPPTADVSISKMPYFKASSDFIRASFAALTSFSTKASALEAT